MWTLKDDLTYRRLKAFTSRLSSFISSYAWLSDSYMLEFFTNNHWDKLPQSWRNVLDNLDLAELADWLSPQENLVYKKVWPLSLISFRAAAHSFTEMRSPQNGLNTLLQLLEETHAHCPSKSSSEVDSSEASTSTHSVIKSQPKNLKSISTWDSFENHLELSSLPHHFSRCVKPKKQHEIKRLAQIIRLVMDKCKSQLIFDVGAGQGHLSRLLSLGYGFPVISIDAEGLHTAAARKLDAKAIQIILKKEANQKPISCEDITSEFQNAVTESAFQLPQHIIKQISAEASAEEFLDMISCNEKKNSANFLTFLLVGLHTCGNLASTIIRTFTKCQHAVAVISVSCCYMKLKTPEDNPDETPGYPLSHFVQSLTGSLSYQAREVACHAIEIYQTRLKQNAEKLKIHCYRAALEVIITKHYPSMKRIGLHSVKRAETMTFKQYANLAIAKLGLHLPEDDLTSNLMDDCLCQWKQVIVFYSLRLLLAPAIETIILMDRLLFLYENGYHSCIFPAFNPIMSPRNHVIVGVKPY